VNSCEWLFRMERTLKHIGLSRFFLSDRPSRSRTVNLSRPLAARHTAAELCLQRLRRLFQGMSVLSTAALAPTYPRILIFTTSSRVTRSSRRS
jgi:hypothetical protein